MNKLLLVTFMLFISLTNVLADIPKTINYQGRLMVNQVHPVKDGDYSVTFRLYNVPTAGSDIWHETLPVTTRNGYFNTVLGNKSILDINNFNQALWIGIQLDADAEMTPRQQLGTAAYALNVADDVITNCKIKADAITSEKIKDGEISTTNINDSAVTTNKIAANAITTSWNHFITPPESTTYTNSENFVEITSFTINPSGGDLLVMADYSFCSGSKNKSANFAFRLSINNQYFAPHEDGFVQRIRNQYYPGDDNSRNIYQSGSFTGVITGVPAGDYTLKLECKKIKGDSIVINDDNSISITAIELKK